MSIQIFFDILKSNWRDYFKELFVSSKLLVEKSSCRVTVAKVYCRKTMKEIKRNYQNYNKYKTIHIMVSVNYKELNSHIKKVT